MPDSKEFGADPDLFEVGNTASTNCTDKLIIRDQSENEDDSLDFSLGCSDHLEKTELKIQT